MNKEYWDTECNMSREKLYSVMYACAILRGSIPDMFTLGADKYTPKQNSRNTVFLRIVLPAGKKEAFEEMTGLKLRQPPKVQVN